ncbi:RNA-binding protein [archaeon]|nr:RNA-binding protein [archaeon]|tara:strand:- start:629 stop:1438 length:810 start_codon:yes stop_codon:yes gene_type:complete
MSIKYDPNVMRDMIANDKRTGGRAFDAYRDIQIETGVAPLAEGSCRVKIGDTDVIAGVKAEIGTPYPDSPAEGSISVNSEFLIFANEKFEPGRPSDESIEVSRVVDRAIRESKSIDFKKLCIEEGEKIWMIGIDIDIMNADGNLIDAACLAATTALTIAKMPEMKEDGRPDKSKKGKNNLPVNKMAVNTSFVKIEDKIIVDPDEREEEAMEAKVTIGTYESLDGKESGLCSMQKGGESGFTFEELSDIIDLAEVKGKELREKIKKAIKA